jgi:hypothetical protein
MFWFCRIGPKFNERKLTRENKAKENNAREDL